MEVAGLVLGALPLAIQVFEKYRTILSTMKNTKQELDSIIRDLQTEKLILENTCESLLRGIASDFEIEHMIQHPYGDAWKEYDDEVRLRVWRSGRLFQELVEDMRNATAELEGKLALDSYGKVSPFAVHNSQDRGVCKVFIWTARLAVTVDLTTLISSDATHRPRFHTERTQTENLIHPEKRKIHQHSG